MAGNSLPHQSQGGLTRGDNHLQSSMTLVSSRDMKPCEFCGKKFSGTKGVRAHQSGTRRCTNMTMKQYFTCGACQFRCASKEYIDYHVAHECAYTHSKAAGSAALFEVATTQQSSEDCGVDPRRRFLSFAAPPSVKKGRELDEHAEFEIQFAACMRKGHVSNSVAISILKMLRAARLTAKVVAKVASYPTILRRICTPSHYLSEPFSEPARKVHHIDIPDPSFHLDGTGTPCRRIAVYYNDVMEELVKSVYDPDVLARCGSQAPYITSPTTRFRTIKGRQLREYKDASDGEWWHAAHKSVNGGAAKDGVEARKVFPVGAYTDETGCALEAKRSAKPLIGIAGILHPDCRSSSAAWKLIGFIPKLKPSKLVAKTKAFQKFKSKFYHECLDVMLTKPLKQCVDEGGFWLRLGASDATPELFVPAVQNIIMDMPEAYAMCGQRLGEKCFRPCLHCWVRREDASTVAAARGKTVRTAESNLKCLRILRKNHLGQATQLEKKLSEYSLVDVENGTADMPFGAEGLGGINGATGLDILHQYLLGIMKRTWINIKALLQLQPEATDRIAQLDSWFNSFKSRHSDPALPRKRFIGSTFGQKSLTGKEYIPLLWQLMVILADGRGQFLPPAMTDQTVELLNRVLVLYHSLWKEAHDEDELDELDVLINDMLTRFKELFAQVNESCTFPKFHATLHYRQQIQRFGNLRVLDAGVCERQHKDQIKSAYRLTSRRLCPESLRSMADKNYESFRIRTLGRAIERIAKNGGNPQSRLTPVEQRVDKPVGVSRCLKLWPELKPEQPLCIPPSRRAEFLDAFKSSLENLLSELTGLTWEEAAKAVEITCVHSFSVQLPGSPMLQLLRASPGFRYHARYDFVKLKQPDGTLCVAKLLLIASICWNTRSLSGGERSVKRQKIEANTRLVAFVEFYCSALSFEKDSLVFATDDVAGARDINQRHRSAGIPVVQLEPDRTKRYALVCSSDVVGGLWVQTGFTDPRASWVLCL